MLHSHKAARRVRGCGRTPRPIYGALADRHAQRARGIDAKRAIPATFAGLAFALSLAIRFERIISTSCSPGTAPWQVPFTQHSLGDQSSRPRVPPARIEERAHDVPDDVLQEAAAEIR